MQSLNPLTFGLATAITVVIINALWAGVVLLWRDATFYVANSFAHGLDLRSIKSTEPFNARRFLLGTISLGAMGFVAGAVFASSHNLLSNH